MKIMAVSKSDSLRLFEDLPLRPDFSIEAGLMRDGHAPIVGLDEVGRGPLAGPVVAAAVVLDPNQIPDGLNDSKMLSESARDTLYEIILQTAQAVSVSSLCATSIDGSNILRASLEAMRRAVASLCHTPAYALADGRDVPPGLPCPCKPVIKGDRRSQSIAAASIVAKVTRDRMMNRAGLLTPIYGFDSHVGYATKKHRAALEEHGPLTRLHRMSFAPLKNTISAQLERRDAEQELV